MTRLKNYIIKKEANAKIGALRVFCAIFFGLTISYLILMIFAKNLEFSTFENIVLAIILLPFFWSIIALWIVLSTSKLTILLKSITPLIVLSFYFYLGN